jgi:putative copper export protein
MADDIAIGLRALSSAASLVAAGLPIFVLLHGPLLDRSSRRIRSALVPAALVALILTLLHVLVEPVRLAGTWSGVFDVSLHALLLQSDFGTTIVVRLFGLAFIAVCLRKAGRGGERFAIVGAVLVAASFVLMGHTSSDPQRWLLAPLLFVHLIAIAFWFGSLWPLAVAARFESAAVAGAVIAQFSRTAVGVVPLILLAGLAMSVLLLPGLSSLRTPYGLLLVTKLVGFAMLMALAALNKWRLARGVSLGDQPSVTAFRWSVLAEWLMIFAVIIVTAVMTGLYSPE